MNPGVYFLRECSLNLFLVGLITLPGFALCPISLICPVTCMFYVSSEFSYLCDVRFEIALWPVEVETYPKDFDYLPGETHILPGHSFCPCPTLYLV